MSLKLLCALVLAISTAIAAAACGSDSSSQPPRLFGAVAGVTAQPGTPQPDVELPHAERVDNGKVRIAFTTGSCGGPEDAESLPTAISGVVEDGVLSITVDTTLHCAGDHDSAGFNRIAMLDIVTDKQWSSVTVASGRLD